MNDSLSNPRPTTSFSAAGIAVSVFTVVASAGLAFFAIGALMSPSSLLPAGATVDIYAQFMAARNLPLALGFIVALFVPDRRILATLLTTGGLVQAGDLLIGLGHHAVAIVIAPVVLAILYFATAAYLFRHPGRASMP